MEDTRPDTPEQMSAGAETAAGATSAAEIETLSTQLGDAEKTIADLKDAMLRERADIENQRRRLQRELEQARRFANEGLLRELLAVCDSLEHGLAVDTDNAAALREGMQLTLKSLNKVVSEHGLKVVDPVGQPFDPELHQAMSMVPTGEQAPDTVVSVMQKGYVLNDRLLRPALVMVAKAPEA
ncbi:MAG TPA: nucleotide exchange factor GrpE [Oleiagrimonas sp.]|nr:nucleotide exchange factor GrpE [Oleiagrimonas sp.]